MMDCVGEHPSRICGRVDFHLEFGAPPAQQAEALVQDCLESAIAEYTGLYGDKTKVLDAATGRPKVERHYDVRREGARMVVQVHGSTGHMGAILENDGAITKMATLVRALVLSKPKLEALAGSPVVLELAGRKNHEYLKLEGGQGFVPTHRIEEVMDRMTRAARRGAEAYLSLIGRPGGGAAAVRGSYDKLHNAAFDGDPDSPTMRRAIAAARQCGAWRDEPVIGWTVSCDARLFAVEHPDMPVITSGAGILEHAHSDHEQLSLDALVKSVEFVSLFILEQTGAV
jgi:acetylornithine deacetylase/succinyl-diaminopimelate desuccinylase-like protein